MLSILNTMFNETSVIYIQDHMKYSILTRYSKKIANILGHILGMYTMGYRLIVFQGDISGSILDIQIISILCFLLLFIIENDNIVKEDISLLNFLKNYEKNLFSKSNLISFLISVLFNLDQVIDYIKN